jgi:hypothetical protein
MSSCVGAADCAAAAPGEACSADCAKAPGVSAKTDTKTDTDSTETWKAANRRGRRGWQSDSSVSLMNLSPMNLSPMNLSLMNLSLMN